MEYQYIEMIICSLLLAAVGLMLLRILMYMREDLAKLYPYLAKYGKKNMDNSNVELNKNLNWHINSN